MATGSIQNCTCVTKTSIDSHTTIFSVFSVSLSVSLSVRIVMSDNVASYPAFQYENNKKNLGVGKAGYEAMIMYIHVHTTQTQWLKDKNYSVGWVIMWSASSPSRVSGRGWKRPGDGYWLSLGGCKRGCFTVKLRRHVPSQNKRSPTPARSNILGKYKISRFNSFLPTLLWLLRKLLPSSDTQLWLYLMIVLYMYFITHS